MKKVVIVESPTKTKSIARYLGDDFVVVSSKGHIRDLAKSGPDRLGIDIENGFTPKYVVSKDKKDVVKSLKQTVKNSEMVYLATDPDREGEAISWHLAQELGLDLTAENRVVFNEITKNAVTKAFNQPRTIDLALVSSQETRRMLDRIIGFKLSRLLQTKIKSKSAGRVQSVALKLIVEKEAEIAAFVIEEYWTVHADFELNQVAVTAELTKIAQEKPPVLTSADTEKIIAETKAPFLVTDINETVKKRQPRLVFTTSTLQQEAATKLGFSAKKTMMLAQKLYEGKTIENALVGLITYMRTDSTRLSQEFVQDAFNCIEMVHGADYRGVYRVKAEKGTQDAHEGIRPTNLEYQPEKIKQFLAADEYKLYRLIYNRALASLMAPAQVRNQAITFTQADYDFVARGNEIVFAGYLKVYGDYESNKAEILPDFLLDHQYTANQVYGKQHFTEPPLRYSEARLIKTLEELGIGRPSTYASIIEMIQKRAYVSLEKSSEGSRTKVFVPTEKGILTNTELAKYFSSIINVKYTAAMEDELDQIAENQLSNVQLLTEFYHQFEPLVDYAYEKMEKVEPVKIGKACPLCGHDLVIREGRYGKFISCSAYPTCKYTRALDEEKKAADKGELLEELCPECGSPLIKRKSRYGTYFIGCSNFPKCRYIKKEPKEPKKKADAES